MDALAILGLAGLLFVKEAGVPVPVPGDLLVLGAGVAAAGDPATGLAALGAILLAGYAGGGLQFLLVRGTLRRAMLAVLARLGVPRARIDALSERLRRSGVRGVAVARATPGVRIAAIAASGLAALPLSTFGAGLVAGNTVFVGGHFALGYVAGPPALSLLPSGGLVVAVAAFVFLALVGAVGWLAIRRRRATAAPVPAVDRLGGQAFAAWADAACPACLTLAVLRGTTIERSRNASGVETPPGAPPTR